jgi:O-antigen ligase
MQSSLRSLRSLSLCGLPYNGPAMTPPNKDTLARIRTDTLQKASFWLLLGAVSSALLSIAAAQILLAGAFFAFGWQWKNGQTRFEPWRPVLLPLLLYLLWGLIASAFARAPMMALRANRKIFLYAILLLTPAIVRKGKEHIAIFHAIFAMAAIAALDGLIQYAMQPQRDLLNRISGSMSIWMTYAGLLMLALVVLAGYSLGRRKIELWSCLLGLMMVIALILSETRNAWIGSTAGVMTVFLMRKPRALFLLLPLLVGLFLISPEGIRQRVRSTLDPNDDNTRNRIELVGTALRLIRDNPWLGVGPENVATEALRYRGTNEFPDFMYQHMHNNFLQVASERGIPGLLLWLWFMGRLGWDSATVYRQNRGNSVSGAESEFAILVSCIAMGALVSLLVAGLAEWNFNDSEVLILFMFLVAAPYTYLQKNAADQVPVAARIGL